MSNTKDDFQLPTMSEIVNAKPFSQLIAEGLLDEHLQPTDMLREQLKQKATQINVEAV